MKVNANLLEISQWQYKLISAGVSRAKFDQTVSLHIMHVVFHQSSHYFFLRFIILRAEVVATAFVSQMESEERNLREAKNALESALSAGLDAL